MGVFRNTGPAPVCNPAILALSSGLSAWSGLWTGESKQCSVSSRRSIGERCVLTTSFLGRLTNPSNARSWQIVRKRREPTTEARQPNSTSIAPTLVEGIVDRPRGLERCRLHPNHRRLRPDWPAPSSVAGQRRSPFPKVQLRPVQRKHQRSKAQGALQWPPNAHAVQRSADGTRSSLSRPHVRSPASLALTPYLATLGSHGE